MRRTGRTMLFFAATAVLLPLSGNAQDTKRTVDQYKCKDILRETGSNREVAIAFLHGYLLGKAGSHSFDLQSLAKQTDAFIEFCLDNPSESAAVAMTKIKG